MANRPSSLKLWTVPLLATVIQTTDCNGSRLQYAKVHRHGKQTSLIKTFNIRLQYKFSPIAYCKIASKGWRQSLFVHVVVTDRQSSELVVSPEGIVIGSVGGKVGRWVGLFPHDWVLVVSPMQSQRFLRLIPRVLVFSQVRYRFWICPWHFFYVLQFFSKNYFSVQKIINRSSDQSDHCIHSHWVVSWEVVVVLLVVLVVGPSWVSTFGQLYDVSVYFKVEGYWKV